MMDIIAAYVGYFIGAVFVLVMLWLGFVAVIKAAISFAYGGNLITDAELKSKTDEICDTLRDILKNKDDSVAAAMQVAYERINKLEESYGRLKPSEPKKIKRVPPRFTEDSFSRSQAV